MNKRTSVVNWCLIALNIVFFLFLETVGSSEDADTMLRYGAEFTPYVIEGKEYWRLLTSMFMHFGIDHIANNMIVLFMIGDNLERALGHVKYLIFYLICGIGANIVSLFFEMLTGNYSVSAGASGAVFGVMGGLLWAVIANRGRLEELTSQRMAIFIVLSLYYGFISTGVDNAAHVGGAVIGFCLSMLIYKKKNRNNYYRPYNNDIY
ncbi:hypothetical protein HMPREF9333_01631 [Johnsonella ignava ATCC 51276]|jgi:hypothetical protein|uniref:Peptidase S54 rhomboid domain-containing protein n=1 Tax=Johnsonella ignava ATCC 51276 TaxID=679200 RepID=G5GJ91_9FIRM|nr:rhomboid family intramembrane serine protease [Johnsonella ignava]EHI55216.1 hypothetical protein HMPREF9333_01631 [Johnsonella ignava ATCC 51276]